MENVPLIDDAGERGKLLHDARAAWIKGYTNVAGEYPFKDAPGKRKASVVLRCALDVTTAGKIAIALNSSENVHIWIDGAPTPPADRVTLDLSTGKHTLDFWVDIAGGGRMTECDASWSMSPDQPRAPSGRPISRRFGQSKNRIYQSDHPGNQRVRIGTVQAL